MIIIAEIIGWIATIFRSAGMMVKSANWVKYLVSIGNFCWMVNGIFYHNIPLITSNAICLLILGIDLIKERYESKHLKK